MIRGFRVNCGDRIDELQTQKSRPFVPHGKQDALRMRSGQAGATKNGTRPVGKAGQRYSGRSKQRPYGILLRQRVWVKKAGASSRTLQNRYLPAFTRGRLLVEREGSPGWPLPLRFGCGGGRNGPQSEASIDTGRDRRVRDACRSGGANLRWC
jgi:hypothetical protein